MIFSLVDLYNYKRRKGRYGQNAVGTFMTMGFENRVPAETIDMLEPGDALFTQRMDSLTSWAIMYFSSSEIDHGAVYIGDGRALHMTLGGSKVHSINAIASGARILPIRFGRHPSEVPFDLPKDAKPKVYHPKFPISLLPTKLQFVWGGIRILVGLHPDRFRWHHIIDLLVLCFLIDVAALWFTKWPYVTTAGCLITVLAVLNLARLKLYTKLGGKITYLSHPDLGWRSFSRIGGTMFTNLGPLVLTDFGILPLGAFLSMSRKGADNSAPHELKELCKSARHLAERWGWTEYLDQAEDEQSNQNDIK